MRTQLAPFPSVEIEFDNLLKPTLKNDSKGSAFRSSAAGLSLLRCRQFRETAHMLHALLRPAATLGGAGADKTALDVRQSAENGNYQLPGAVVGVGHGSASEQKWCAERN